MEKQFDRLIKKLLTYRWVVWGVLVIAFIMVHFYRMSIGVVRDDLVLEFNISAITFANIGSAYFYIYMVMQIPSGLLADSLGPRVTVAAGTFISGLGSIIFGLAPSIFWIMAGRVLVGLGLSVIYISILKIIAQWFKTTEFATMSGATSFMAHMGGAFAQTPLALLLGLVTWRLAFVGIGVWSIALAVLCWALARNKPEDMGLPPVTILEKDCTAPPPAATKPDLRKGLLTVLKNRGTWVAFLIAFGHQGSFLAFTGVWGITYLVQVYGMSRVTAANYMMAVLVACGIGCVLIGRFSDAIKKRKLPMLLFGFVHTLIWFSICLIWKGRPPLPYLMPLLVLLGLSAVPFILAFVYSKEINPVEIAGISTSVVNAGTFLGGSALPVLVGLIIDRYESLLPPAELYALAFLGCFFSALLGLVLSFMVKETGCRQVNAPSPQIR